VQNVCATTYPLCGFSGFCHQQITEELAAMSYDDDYLAFYEVYPRHEGKADGQKAWGTLSESDRKLAKADVEKRKRNFAYSSNKKMIQLPASYLRARRWEDDWQDTLESSRKGDDLPNTGPFVPQAKEPEIEITWQERMLNRLFRSYLFTAMGLPEVATALNLKREALAESRELLDEPLPVQVRTLAELFVGRLDAAYGLDIKHRALKFAKRAKT